MTAKTLKPYPKYKDSGVSWIGMVPVGWEVIALKHVCKVNAPVSHITKYLKDDTLVTFLPMEKISIDGKIDCSQKEKYIDVKTGYSSFAKDDVIIAKITPCFENGKGACLDVLDTDIGFGTTELINLRPYNKIASRFLFYITMNKIFRIIGADHMTGSAGQKRVPAEFVKNYIIPLPPRTEQDDIVAYLDDKTAKIDRLIGLYKREIELLKERRQAVIHKAVTRGLDDKVKLKDSGVSWIGMVPQGWGVSTVGHLFNSFLGKMLEQSSNSSQPNSEYKPYICAKDVHFDGVDITDSKLMKFNRQEIQKYSVKRGDLLIVEGGAGAGGSAIYNYDDERMVQNSIHVVRNRGFLLNKYLYYWMYSLVSRNYIDAVCNKATIPHFTGEKLTATMIPLPPRSEQDAIVAYLDDQCAKVDTMIGNVQSKIGLLEEYRVRLISDVVTGKVRV